jgi:hypothetical protein
LLKTRCHTPVRLVLPVVLLAAAALAATAQQPATPEQKEHVVRRGDTLWDLARAYLQNPFMWPVIYEANRDVVEDPHWIYPLERLRIPPLVPAAPADSRPAEPPGLTRTSLSVEPPTTHALAALAAAAGGAVPADTPVSVLSTVDLRRPAVTLHEFLSAPWLSVQPAAATTGRVVQKTDPAAAAERMVPTLYPQELVNVTITAGAVPAVGDSLLIVRAGRRVGTAGSIVQPMGILRIEQVTGPVVTGRVVAQFADARVGDMVAPLPVVPALPMGSPQPVTTPVAGHVLQFMQREGLHSPTDHAFLSIGRGQGIGIGDELSVYVPAGQASPAVQVAVVRVVRADDATSTARVVSVSSTALREGLPVSLLRKMP